MVPETAAQHQPQGDQQPAAQAAPQAVRPVATVAAAQTAARAAVAPPAQAVAPQVSVATQQLPSAHPTVPVASPAAQAGAPPRKRPSRKGKLDLPLLRIVCWQFALVLALLAFGRPLPWLLVLLFAAVVLVVLSASRVDGRWLSDELAQRARLALRRRDRDLPDTEASGALLELLAPGARVLTVELAGTSSGVVSRSEELLAVLRPVDTDVARLADIVLAGSLVTDHGDSGYQPVVRLQLVLHRGPQRTDETRAWLAVRVIREPGFVEDTELLAVLDATVRKLHRKLRKSGIPIATLTERELLSTLVALTHTGPGRGQLRELRRYWRTGPVTQIGLRLRGLGARSPQARMHALHRYLGGAPGSACTVSVTVPTCAAVVRIAALTDAAADAAADHLTRLPLPGLRLERMDNQHGPAAAASLPIGGNL